MKTVDIAAAVNESLRYDHVRAQDSLQNHSASALRKRVLGATGARSPVAQEDQPGLVAQLVEQGIFNPTVAGSKPAQPINGWHA